LHFHIAAQAYTISYHHILANTAVFAQLTTCHQMSEVPNTAPSANTAAVVEYSSGMGKIGKRISHESR
jgi:hypothetical protein